MADYNHKYNAADIEKYLNGELTPKERHALEKAALDDPFLADAIDGYTSTPVNIPGDLSELRKRLQEQDREAKVIPIAAARKSGFPWLRAAIMIAVLAAAGWMVYQLGFNNDRQPEIARQERTETPAVSREGSIADSIAPNNNQKPEDQNSEASLPAEEPRTIRTNTTDNLPPPPPEGNVTTGNKNVSGNNGDEQLMEEKVDAMKKTEVAAQQQREARVDAEKENQLRQQDMRSEHQVIPRNAEVNNISSNRRDMAPDGSNNADPLEMYRNVNVFRGRVVDAHNNALPFANVTNTKDNVGTYSDAKGNFTLVSTDSILDVQVRSLGYENRRMVLNDELPVNEVLLEEDKNITAKVLDTVKRNLSRVRGGNLRFEEPEPADGWDYYDTYLVNNLNMPETFARKNSLPGGGGEVEVSFEVNRRGEPINIVVEKSLCEQCDKEAIRLIKQGPKWKRKAKKGRTTVKVPFY